MSDQPEIEHARGPEDGETTAAPVAGETRIERLRRRGQHAKLYAWSFLLVAMLVVVAAMVASNTRQVKLSWVFGTSHASLIWIVIIPAIAGWLAGIATAIVVRRRTRAGAGS